MSVLLVLSPIFEADLLRNQYGFRPQMDAKMAIRQTFWQVSDHGRSEVSGHRRGDGHPTSSKAPSRIAGHLAHWICKCYRRTYGDIVERLFLIAAQACRRAATMRACCWKARGVQGRRLFVLVPRRADIVELRRVRLDRERRHQSDIGLPTASGDGHSFPLA